MIEKILKLKKLPQYIDWKFYLLKNKLKVAKELPATNLAPIRNTNRAALAAVPRWVDKDVYENSIFHYGLPRDVLPLIDKPIGESLTYSDAMLFYAQQLTKPICYLEMGVSVGKNFFQVSSALKNAEIWGFDIEDINPVLAAQYKQVAQTSWPTQKGSVRKKDSTLTTFRDEKRNNTIYYIAGDIFDEQSWQPLVNKKFNMMFSDAFHSPYALLHEWEMIRKYDLVDPDEFVLAWDDLNKRMDLAFKIIWLEMRNKHQLSDSAMKRMRLNGWVGIENHENGFILKTNR